METSPSKSREVAQRAITEALISAMRMSAETGNPTVFRVEHRLPSGAVRKSPYGVYVFDDPQELSLYTGVQGRETISIAKESIVGIELTRVRDIARSLNDLDSRASLDRAGQAALASLLESYHQWLRMFLPRPYVRPWM
ncbi:MAG: hypothetical protein ACOY3P_17915 [Planctomycetota bacterium]